MTPDEITEATAAYVECALWAGSDWRNCTEHGGTDDNPRPLDDLFGPDDLSPEAWEQARQMVTGFAREHWAAARAAGWTASQFGHDLHLSRNGHGAGYFDRYPQCDYNGGDTADRLQDAARLLGECELSPGDDGRLNFDR